MSKLKLLETIDTHVPEEDYNEKEYKQYNEYREYNKDIRTDINWDFLEIDVRNYLQYLIEEYRKMDPRFEWISLIHLTEANKNRTIKITRYNTDKLIYEFVIKVTKYLKNIFKYCHKKIIKTYGTVEEFYRNEESDEARDFIEDYSNGRIIRNVYMNIFERLNKLNIYYSMYQKYSDNESCDSDNKKYDDYDDYNDY